MYVRPSIPFFERYFNDHPEFALHAAVLNNSLPRIEELLAAGFDINKLDDVPLTPNHFGTPLHVAIWCDQIAAFKLLFTRGADLEILDEGGEFRQQDTPIRLAVRLGRREMFKMLWDAGVEQNKYAAEVSAYGRRSLIEITSGEGHTAILQDLLDWNTAWTSDQMYQALWIACSEWHVNIVAVLLSHCHYSPQELEDGMQWATTSLPCVRRPRIERKERLLTLKEDSELQAKVMGLLLDAHAQNVGGVRAVYDPSVILNRLLLIVSGSPFMVGALATLLKRGADPNAQSAEDGLTPLHIAVVERRDIQRCNEEGAALLLEHGARTDVLNKEGDSAVDYARKNGDDQTVQKLIRHRKVETED